MGCGPAPGPTLKRRCAILIRLLCRKTNTNSVDQTPVFGAPLQLVLSTAQLGRVCLPTEDLPGLRRQPPVFYSLRGVRFIAWLLRRTFKGMPAGHWYFKKMLGACELWPCVRTHLKKILCRLPSIGGTGDKHSWPNLRDTITCDTTCVGNRYSLPLWSLRFLLTNYYLTSLLASCFCYLNICVFLSIFLCSSCLSFCQHHSFRRFFFKTKLL